MQKILQYEMTVAMKDRPKIFQVITLGLLSFSLIVILISFLTHFSPLGHNEKQAYKEEKPSSGYVSLAAAPAGHMLHVKK